MDKNNFNRKIKLLYIGGYSRCGSTILSNVLGEIEGFFNAGELMYMWNRMISDNGICGCGEKVIECKIWSKVIKKAFGDARGVDCEKMIQLRNSAWKSSNVPFWCLFPKAEVKLLSTLSYYFMNLEKLYAAIGSEVPEEVIIDSSKNPAYLHLLSLVAAVDLYVVHIVRDSRANAYSWLSNKEGFSSRSAWRSALSWNARNSVFEFFKRRFPGKYMLIRYEDFVSDPPKILKAILRMLGEEHKSLDFIKEDGIAFGENHCVFGNPDLFKKGLVKLRLDERWRSMKIFDKLTTISLTWPLMKRFGYRIFR